MESIKHQFYQHVLEVKGTEFANELNEVISFFDTVALPQKFSRKTTKHRDPTRPKRPLSAYLAFSKAKRPDIKAANPDKKSTEILTLTAQLWRTTSEDDRSEFVKIAQESKARYDTEIAKWKKNNAKVRRSVVTSETANEGAQTDDNTLIVTKKPRGCITPFAAFMKAKRREVKEQHLDKSANEITRILRSLWKTTSKEDRVPFKDIVAKDKVRYQREMDAWESYKQTTQQTATEPSENAAEVKPNDEELRDLTNKWTNTPKSERPSTEDKRHISNWNVSLLSDESKSWLNIMKTIANEIALE